MVRKERARPNVQPGRSTLFRAHLNSLIKVAKPLAPWSVARTVIYSRCFSGHPYLLGVSRHGNEGQGLLPKGRMNVAHHQEYANSSVSTSCFPLEVCREPAPPVHESRLHSARDPQPPASQENEFSSNTHTNYDETPGMRRFENRFFDLGVALHAVLIDLVELG